MVHSCVNEQRSAIQPGIAVTCVDGLARPRQLVPRVQAPIVVEQHDDKVSQVELGNEAVDDAKLLRSDAQCEQEALRLRGIVVGAASAGGRSAGATRGSWRVREECVRAGCALKGVSCSRTRGF